MPLKELLYARFLVSVFVSCFGVGCNPVQIFLSDSDISFSMRPRGLAHFCSPSPIPVQIGGHLHVQTASIGYLGIMYRARIGRRISGTGFPFPTWEVINATRTLESLDSERLGNNARAATFWLFSIDGL